MPAQSSRERAPLRSLSPVFGGRRRRAAAMARELRMADGVGETQEEYKARVLSYQAGADPLALQAAAPDMLASLVAGMSSSDLDWRPESEKWSAREIVAHLADDELVGAYRIRLILSAPGTPIEAFNQDVWARTGRYSSTDLAESLQLFRVLRHANLGLLRSLSPTEWEMSGVHAERGKESLREIAMYYAGHDINHFRQLESIRRRRRAAEQGDEADEA